MARPKTNPDTSIVAVTGREAKSKLQPESERRAIVQRVIDNGGRMTIAALNKAFGYDVRAKINGLMRSKWLEVVK